MNLKFSCSDCQCRLLQYMLYRLSIVSEFLSISSFCQSMIDRLFVFPLSRKFILACPQSICNLCQTKAVEIYCISPRNRSDSSPNLNSSYSNRYWKNNLLLIATRTSLRAWLQLSFDETTYDCCGSVRGILIWFVVASKPTCLLHNNRS